MPKEWKKQEVKELKSLLDEYPVVGTISMHKLPSPQLEEMRKDLHGKAKVRMSRKTLMKFALEESDKEDIEDLKDYLQGESAFIFTEMNPFSLYKYLQENKSSAPAKPGDVAPKDIEIESGNTGIDPGPAIGKLQSIGLKTKIEDGKIHVAKDKVVVEQGEEIDGEHAEALRMLEMEPMEIGLNIQGLWEDGVVFERSDLELDTEEYEDKLKAAYQRAMNLSINSSYVTEQNIEMLISKAWNEAKSVSIESDYVTEETAKDIIGKAHNAAKTLKSKTEEV